MKQIAWMERKFYFVETQNVFPGLMVRLEGTPARLEEKVRGIDDKILHLRMNDSWSVKENIGHLIEVETLWQGRLQDVLNGEKEMRAADLTNRKTFEGNYNDKEIESILETFRNLRHETLSAMRMLQEEDIFKSALHPRLKQPMRIYDHFYFVAEHDDHHLARIDEIKSKYLHTHSSK